MNVDKPLSELFRKAASGLLTSDEVNQLMASRETLEAKQRRHQEELQRAEAAKLQAIEEQRAVHERAETARLQAIAEQRAVHERAEAARLQAIAEQRAAQEKLEEDEFCQLVAEMSALGFTNSKQVSTYIVRHKLGHKYKNISGVLQMELDGNVWNFNGGFPPEIYARLCKELGLGNQGTRARAGAFTPYKDII